MKTKLIKKKKKKTKVAPEDDAINFQELGIDDQQSNASISESSAGIVEEVLSPETNVKIKAFTFNKPSELKQTDTIIEILEIEDESETIPAMPVPSGNAILRPVVLEDKVKISNEGEKVSLKPVRTRQKVAEDTTTMEAVSLKAVKKHITVESQEKLTQSIPKETAEVSVSA